MPVRWVHVRKLTLALCSFTALFALFAAFPPGASAQEALITALKQRFHLTEITTEGVIAEPGTVLTIQVPGINAEPYPTMITFENPVVNGRVKQRSKFLGFVRSTNSQILQPGQKVYVTKINASEGKKDQLKVTILTADAFMATYDNTSYGGGYQTPKRYSTTLAFQLPKGSLATMTVPQATKLIEAVLSYNPKDQGQVRAAGVITNNCEPNCTVSATTGAPAGGAVVSSTGDASSVAPASAPTIALGQTPDQVTAIMGEPKQIVDLGVKKIYVYPSMKIFFTNNKVSNVE